MRRFKRWEWMVMVAGLVVIALAVTGCAAKGMVRATEIADLVDKVCERHDGYVAADMTGDQRESALRSCELLRQAIKEAQQPKP